MKIEGKEMEPITNTVAALTAKPGTIIVFGFSVSIISIIGWLPTLLGIVAGIIGIGAAILSYQTKRLAKQHAKNVVDEDERTMKHFRYPKR